MTSESGVFDVAVIGAGIVGSAIARRLSEHNVSVALIESRSDVGDGTSKANTAILHTGFDAKPGTLESRMVSRGYELLSKYAKEVGIPVEKSGAILVAWNQEQLDALPSLKKKAAENGYTKSKIVDAKYVYEQLPHLGKGALGGLTVPDESIICTWTTNLALATEAVMRGVDLRLNYGITKIKRGKNATTLVSARGSINAKLVINAAGLGGDYIDDLFGYDRYHVIPRRGELIVFDKQSRPLVNKIVLPVPTAIGKGVLVSPTIYGNVMLGPTAEDLEDRTATCTSEEGFEFLLGKGETLMPELLEEEVTATYAGLRAASNLPDYLIDLDETQNYLLVGGVRSTGLTSGIAVAEYVDDLLIARKLIPKARRKDLPKAPSMPNIGESFLRPYQDKARIEADPAYGKIVCFCERVTAGEIRDVFSSPIPPATTDGLRRRTRAQNGRCQGFFCGAEVKEIFDSKGACVSAAPSKKVEA